MEKLITDAIILPDTEVFMFTDNSTSEAAFHKGTSKSKLLFDLALSLRELEMEGNVFMHVIWVAGTRMIDQGTDGLSRGDLMNGVLAGRDMLDFVPLHGSVYDRWPDLITFLMEPMRGLFDPIHLDPDGWYDRAFEPSNYVWTPPPAAALKALEQMCESKHIRPSSAHVFVCADLMSNRWRKKLGRIADVIFTIPVGLFLWDTAEHGPVIVALILPLLNCRPWQYKRERAWVDEFVGALQGVWTSDKALSGIICANFGCSRGTTLKCSGAWHDHCYTQHKEDKFPVLRAADLDNALMDTEDDGEDLDDPDRFKVAQAGDFLMCPFQCYWCNFYNIKLRYPAADSGQDKLLLICIRRAVLNSFWLQERSTVQKNQTEIAGILRSAKLLGIERPFPDRGPFPVGDTFGMGTACALLIDTAVGLER
ncbi:hypothetical protein ACA910_016595 [Epithemia clementina (nom. ined.)]